MVVASREMQKSTNAIFFTDRLSYGTVGTPLTSRNTSVIIAIVFRAPYILNQFDNLP